MRPLATNNSDNNNNGKKYQQLKTLKTLLPFLWPKKRLDLKTRVVFALIALGLAKLANIYVPILYKDAVDTLSSPKDVAILTIPIALLVAYGLTRLLTVIFQEIREALFAKVAQNAIRTVALHTFKHLHKLSLKYHLERQTGGLSRIVERGIKGIEFLLNFTLFNILPTLLEIFLVCIVLWYMYDIWFALVTFSTIGLYIAFTLFVTEWRLKYRRQMNDKDAEANIKAVDSLLNFETVKYFGNEDHEAKRYDNAMRGYEAAAVKSITSLSAVNIGQGGIIAAGLVILMIMAANGVADGSMTIGDFVLVNSYIFQLYLPLNFLGFVYRQIRQSLTDMEDMFELLDVEQDVSDVKDAPDVKITNGVIKFENISFSYDKRRSILKDLSFCVESGKSLAIVGASGAGKSTISRLLFRFYDVNAGKITLDGQDIRQISQKSLRVAIGIVPQDTVLFNDTIYYNIAYGNPAASDDEIYKAAKLAKIYDFINELPDGYQSMVGERGLKLSGGEKQRVAIARTILKNPEILLFDEATSALDTATEREIQTSLREVSKGRTTLIIAHRLSTIVDVDQIIVLDKGMIIEKGRHQDLIKKSGIYAQMWMKQQNISNDTI